MLFRADEIDYNQDTNQVEARGHVYFHHFQRGEEIWAERVEYDVDEETGNFYRVRGTAAVQMGAPPGVLTTDNPFYFEGERAERRGERYILYNGYFTDCKMPRPWWRLRAPRFEVVPGDHATAYRARFVLRGIPLFYTPYFYKSLEKKPRRSGFLMPNIGNSSRRGKLLGLGYFWAVNRSYDVTYRFQDFTARGYAHDIDLRGKPREGTDFNAILYGVQDRGLDVGGGQRLKQGGLSLYLAGQSELGDGWQARALVNYVSSLQFRQAFSETFNEITFSEVHSVGFLNKSWSSNSFNAIFERLENFQSTQPDDSVVIRKFPEFRFFGRDRQFWSRLPLWFSLESSAALMRRTQPAFQTRQFTDRMDLFPHVTSAFDWKGFHFIPSFGIRETHYGESQREGRIVGGNYTRGAREFDFNVVAPSLTRIFDHKTWLGDKLKHVIEPRASFRYVGGVEDFNRIIRFDDTDLMSNTKQAEFSLTNRLYAKRGDTVWEVLSWELLQQRYFDPTFGGAVLPGRRNLVLSAADLTGYAFLDGPRPASPVISVLRMSPANGFGISWRADYDPARGGVVNSGLTADARVSKYFISAGHYQVRSSPLLSPAANQFSGTVGLGDVNRRGWNAAFTAVYDYRIGVMQYAVTQVTYNTDCCGLSVQYRRFSFGSARNENQWRLAFAIANIGSFGTLKKQERLF